MECLSVKMIQSASLCQSLLVWTQLHPFSESVLLLRRLRPFVLPFVGMGSPMYVLLVSRRAFESIALSASLSMRFPLRFQNIN